MRTCMSSNNPHAACTVHPCSPSSAHRHAHMTAICSRQTSLLPPGYSLLCPQRQASSTCSCQPAQQCAHMHASTCDMPGTTKINAVLAAKLDLIVVARLQRNATMPNFRSLTGTTGQPCRHVRCAHVTVSTLWLRTLVSQYLPLIRALGSCEYVFVSVYQQKYPSSLTTANPCCSVCSRGCHDCARRDGGAQAGLITYRVRGGAATKCMWLHEDAMLAIPNQTAGDQPGTGAPCTVAGPPVLLQSIKPKSI